MSLLFLTQVAVADPLGDLADPCGQIPGYAESHKEECRAQAKRDEEAAKKWKEDQLKSELYRKKHGILPEICKKRGSSKPTKNFAKVPLRNPDTSDPSKDALNSPIMISALNKDELQAIFDENVNAYYPWELGLTGSVTENIACADRAHIVGCDLKELCGVTTGKIFVSFKDGEVPVDLGKNGRASWKAHVANVIYLEDETGQLKLMVIDRLLNIARGKKGPIPYEEWVNHITANGKYKIEKSLTYPAQYLPQALHRDNNRADGTCVSDKARERMRAAYQAGRFMEKPRRLMEEAEGTR